MSSIADMTDPFPFRVDLAGQPTAGTPGEWVVMRAAFPAVVKGVTFTPAAAITFDGTNNFTLRLRNRGQAGAGNVQVAVLQFSVVGANATAWTPKLITLGTGTTIVLARGDVLTVEKVNTGTGMVMPAGVLEVLLQSS